jgi:hypothetical protein
MNYNDIRLDIKSGDIIAIHGKTLFARITNLVQYLGGMQKESTISHVGVAWWLEDRLYSVEMDGKHNVLRPLSQYVNDKIKIDIYKCPVDIDILKSNFPKATSDSISYGHWMNVQIGLRLLFRIKSKNNSNSTLVCSTFVSRWLQWSGWNPPKCYPNMPCPAELCRALGNPIFNIRY